MHAKSLQSCSTLCNLMDGSLPGLSVCGILQARILEWVAISFSRGSSWGRNQIWVSYVSCIGSGFFTTSATILIPWALKTENLPHLEPDVEQKKRVREIPSIGRNQHLQDLRELSSSWGLQLTVTRQWELQLYSSGMELCSNRMNLEADSSKPSERYLTSPTLWFRTQLNLCPSLSCITALSWLRGLCNPAAQGYPGWLSHSEEFWQNMVH